MSHIILSRKGFDASCGGVPSPILPDGRLLSLPIPCQHSPMTYDDLHLDGLSIGRLVEDLTRGRIPRSHCAHLDPDLRPEIYPRTGGWRPLFGQTGAAQAHLVAHGIGPGDLFLFFGWFRQVERIQGRYGYVRGAPDLHVIYGWLRVGQVYDLGESTPGPRRSRAATIETQRPTAAQTGPRHSRAALPPSPTDNVPAWAAYHPHCHIHGQSYNALYMAAQGGIIDHYAQPLCLTAPGAGRSLWRLPPWFFPQDRTPLTYHADPRRWSALEQDCVLLRSAARGQEFVLDMAQYPEAEAWARELTEEAC